MMCPFFCNFQTEAYVWETTLSNAVFVCCARAPPAVCCWFGGEEGASERKADGQLRDTVPTLARDGCVGRLMVDGLEGLVKVNESE